MDIGVGIGVIGQTNVRRGRWLRYNSAVANTGDNAQFSGPQVNITGQLALAGAQGGGALSLGLIGAGAFGGDADAAAANIADSTNWQQVCNDLITGIATAINALLADRDAGEQQRAATPRRLVLAERSRALRGRDQPVERRAGAAGRERCRREQRRQHPGRRSARRTSRCRSRLTAPQAGGSAALALGGAVAVDGDAMRAPAGNVSVSDNTTLATNDMTTGDATAINQVQVDVTQNNDNDGDATSVGL